MIVEEANEMRKKFVLLGDEAVGKTSLIRRFVTESFDDKYISTIGTKVTKKNMDMRKDGQLYSIHMMIWDMVGQKNFKLILRSALKGAQGLIMVCDLTRRSTLDSLMEYWFPEVEKCCGKIPMVFLANKSDIVGEAQFELEDLEDVARQHDALFYLTSAKTGENVERTFLALGKASLGSEGKEPQRVFDESVDEVKGEIHVGKEAPLISGVLDVIISDFTEQWKEEEDGMAVVRQQAKMSQLNIRSPTTGQVSCFINRLGKVEGGFLRPEEVAVNQSRRMKLLGRVSPPETMRSF